MPIIIFAGRKGGCGKTTGATNFAAWLAYNGRRVALLDTDPERQAQTFCLLRVASGAAAPIHLEQVTGDVRRTILSLAQDFEWVVVDTPGLDSIETKRALAVATASVWPFKTSIYDLKTIPLADMLTEEIQAIRPDAVALAYASETDTGRSGVSDRDAAAVALGGAKSMILLSSYTAGRKSYRASANAGRGVVEWTDSKASEEFAALAREIVSHVK